MLFRPVVPFVGLLVFGRIAGALGNVSVNKDISGQEFKLSLVVEVLDHILLEASALPIETYSFVGTNESFFRDVVDRLASRYIKLGVPSFNNAMAQYAPSRQLVLIGGDTVDDIMESLVNVFSRQPGRFFGTNSRDIYVILVLSDVRYIESNKFFLLRIFFCSYNFLIVVPPPTPSQKPIVMATDYSDRLVLMQPDAPMDSLFADRFRTEDIPKVNVWGSLSRVYHWQNEHGQTVGVDWTVFRTIMQHMGLRWNLTLHNFDPSLALNEWLNEQLHLGKIDIYLDRSFLPSIRSVAHFLPEMNGICIVVPTSKKFEIFHHMLSPLQPSCWIVLGCMMLIGSLLAHRYARGNLMTVLLFGANLNARGISPTERTLLFSGLVLFFIVSEAYQAKLLSLISTQRYPPNPCTVEEFLRTDIMLEMGETTAKVVSIRSGFVGRVRNRTDYEFAFGDTHEHGVLMLCPAAWAYLLQWIRHQLDQHGHNVRPSVHIVGEKLFSMVASYSFSSSFTLYPRFRRYIEWLFECGLVTHWQSAIEGQQQYERRFTYFDSNIIAFSDLSTIWIAFAIGHAMATLLFCVELLLPAVQRSIRTFIAPKVWQGRCLNIK